jgi:hypothetical protein
MENENIIEIENKSNLINAFDIMKKAGFIKIENRSQNVCREFFTKDCVQYSFAFPIWNGSKVRIIKDNSLD